MIKHITTVRVRYSETDKMGYVYYGNFAQYMEIGRTELLRNVGISYADMENTYGIMLPVYEVKMNYFSPAFYDDLLVLESRLEEKPGVRITILTDIFNKKEIKLFSGSVTLVFCKKENMRPVKAPDFFINAINKKWTF